MCVVVTSCVVVVYAYVSFVLQIISIFQFHSATGFVFSFILTIFSYTNISVYVYVCICVCVLQFFIVDWGIDGKHLSNLFNFSALARM